MMFDCETSTIERMIEYLTTVLEQPHPVFGGLPICPFSKKARLQNKIFYKVLVLTMAQLQADSELRRTIASFQASQQHEVLLFISPNNQALTVQEMQVFVEQLNASLAPEGLTAFGGHPQDTFNVQGVHTRQEPFINLTVQSLAVLQAASRQLTRTAYYQNWSAENLQQVGFHDRNESVLQPQSGN